MLLDDILYDKEREVDERKEKVPLEELEEKVFTLPPTRDFKEALKKPGLSLIAEIKKMSPVRGAYRWRFDPVRIAQIYEENEVDAISVLTDEKYFGGTFEHLKAVKESVSLPVLGKDFIIDEYQIYEHRLWGADAILLIVSIVNDAQLFAFYGLSLELGLTPVLEVHTVDDLKRALRVGAEVIGINNRNLRNFEVDFTTTAELLNYMPGGKIVISESGIKERAHVIVISSLGVDAILIGEAFMRSWNIARKIKKLMGRE